MQAPPNPFPRNQTRRRAASPSPFPTDSNVGLNTELENFLNLNASEAYKRPWHRLERGLRLNRIQRFVAGEQARMNMSSEDALLLLQKLEKALDKKLLNSKSCVIYDHEKEEIQEVKGLIYHRTAEGRIVSSIVDKKVGMTFRKRATKPTAAQDDSMAIKSDSSPS